MFSVSTPASLAFSVPLSVSLLSLSPLSLPCPTSFPSFLLYMFHLCRHLCPCLPLAAPHPTAHVSNLSLSSMSHPYLHLCTSISLVPFSIFLHHCFCPFLSLSPSLSPLFIHILCPHLRPRLFLVLSSFPLLSHLRSPFRDGTSLGAGPRDWIGITRLSGRIELTSSHERRRACFPSLLRGRRWGGQGEGSGPYGWARCID